MSDVAALIRRLRSTRRVEQRQAAVELKQLAMRPDGAMCAQLVAAGCVPPLLELLCAGSTALHLPANTALVALVIRSHKAGGAARLAWDAAVPTLAAMLTAGSARDVERATSLLTCLTDSEERRAAVVAAGGHQALLRLCASDDAATSLRSSACVVLRNLARCEGSKAALLAAEPFPALVGVLRRPELGASSSAVYADSSEGTNPALLAVELAAQAIGELCSSRDSLHSTLGSSGSRQYAAAAAAAAAAGALAALLQLLRAWREEGVRHAAARALACLAHSCDPAAVDSLAAAGGLAAMAQQLCTEACSPRLRLAAMSVLVCLVAEDPQRCVTLAGMPGVLPRLVQLLGGTADSPCEDEQAAAAGILVCLAAAGAQLAAAVVAAGAVPALAAALRAPHASAIPGLQCNAAILAHNLAAGGQSAALRAAGIDQALALLADSQDGAIRQHAANALHSLAVPSGQAAPGSSSPATPAPAAPAGAATMQPRPPRVRRMCAAPGCGASRGLHYCGGCAEVRYCSEACSRAHWRAHRAECRRVQAERAAAQEAAPAADEP